MFDFCLFNETLRKFGRSLVHRNASKSGTLYLFVGNITFSYLNSS